MPSLPLPLYLVWATHGRKLWGWSSFVVVISLIITLTNVRKMIIESIPTALRSAISAGIGIFLAYVGIKNAGFLKFTIDPHTYTVVGEGADKANATISANASAVPGLVDFNDPAVLLALVGLAITIFFVVKGIKGGIILSILATTVLGILYPCG